MRCILRLIFNVSFSYVNKGRFSINTDDNGSTGANNFAWGLKSFFQTISALAVLTFRSNLLFKLCSWISSKVFWARLSKFFLIQTYTPDFVVRISSIDLYPFDVKVIFSKIGCVRAVTNFVALCRLTQLFSCQYVKARKFQ